MAEEAGDSLFMQPVDVCSGAWCENLAFQKEKLCSMISLRRYMA
jgi:hypothetical protein